MRLSGKGPGLRRKPFFPGQGKASCSPGPPVTGPRKREARAEPPNMSVQALQPQALEKLRTLGGEALVSRVVGLFLELGPQRLQAGRQALADGDSGVAERSFHSLRSSAANVGAMEVSRLAALLEERLHRGEVDLEDALDRLEGELAPVLVELRAAVQPPTDPSGPRTGGPGPLNA